MNSNRTSLVDADCDGQILSAASWADNTGDAATTGGNGQGVYRYDEFGRLTTIPAADTPTPSAGDIHLSYTDTDQPHSITQGTTTTSFTYDTAGRRLTQTTTPGLLPSGKEATESLVRHYTDTSDNPTRVVSDSGVVTRYASSLGGDMALTLAGGEASLAVANPHGDVVTTIPIPIPTIGDATQITGWGDYTEYGTPTTPAATHTNGGITGYGWVGAKERATAGETFGVTLMGARYYNPTTGRFTSTDPIYGGNPNTYTYPTNPITGYDLEGTNHTWKDGGSAFISFGRLYTGQGAKVSSNSAKLIRERMAAGNSQFLRSTRSYAPKLRFNYLTGKKATGLQKQIDAHYRELHLYMSDPLRYDNKNFLRAAMKDKDYQLAKKIYNARIESLKRQIRNFERQQRQADGNIR